jgi:hypothetical protein
MEPSLMLMLPVGTGMTLSFNEFWSSLWLDSIIDIGGMEMEMSNGVDSDVHGSKIQPWLGFITITTLWLFQYPYLISPLPLNASLPYRHR